MTKVRSTRRTIKCALLPLTPCKVFGILLVILVQQVARYSFDLVKIDAVENDYPFRHELPYISTQSQATLYETLPDWLQEYITWNRQERLLLNETNWHEQKYYIQRCLATCGGTSDRLRSMVVKVLLAARMKRLLLIQWEKPAKLEAFLVPPASGIDWTVPEWLAEKLLQHSNETTSCRVGKYPSVQFAHDAGCHVMNTMYHFEFSGGAELYNELRDNDDEPDFDAMYRTIWMLLFQPTPPIQRLIHQRLQKLKLRPNQYNAIHIRSQYSEEELAMPNLIENATNCGLSFAGNLPLYIATDSLNATRKALEYAQQYTRHAKAHVTTDHPPLHLSRGETYLSHANEVVYDDSPDVYYSTFVDFYMLASAKCLGVGRGTYGYWANLVSLDPGCVVKYFDWEQKQYNFPPQCQAPPRRLWNWKKWF
ncbi:hypothetical protein MPSEU_001080400 [Mayamaea pseudoterrestris]|nr:hypothetical protein MPSEU_001080400 [Mayamaea pseudoterrestris]